MKSKKSACKCYCCGKSLTDPISIQLGIGPICRVTVKTNQFEDKTGNLFAFRSDYDYRIDDNILAIEDLNGFKSVTNDIENILNDIIKAEQLNIWNFKIMYKDSMGIWDGIKITSVNSFTITFFSINERLYHLAKAKLLEK